MMTFLSFFLSFSLSFFFRPSEVGVGREVDRACSPGRKEGGKCTGGGSAGSVAFKCAESERKVAGTEIKGCGCGCGCGWICIKIVSKGHCDVIITSFYQAINV